MKKLENNLSKIGSEPLWTTFLIKCDYLQYFSRKISISIAKFSVKMIAFLWKQVFFYRFSKIVFFVSVSEDFFRQFRELQYNLSCGGTKIKGKFWKTHIFVMKNIYRPKNCHYKQINLKSEHFCGFPRILWISSRLLERIINRIP